MKLQLVLFAVAACAYATPVKPNGRMRSRALTVEVPNASTTPIAKTTVETTAPTGNYTINPNRGDVVSSKSSETYKALLALADIVRRVVEFVSNVNSSRLFSVEGLRSISYVLFELAPMILGPYSGILRVLLSPLVQNAASSLFE